MDGPALTEDGSPRVDHPWAPSLSGALWGRGHPPVLFNEVQCALCSLETATVTGLFITAKLFAAFFQCRATQCLCVMYVVVTVQHTEECALTLACVMHTKQGP